MRDLFKGYFSSGPRPLVVEVIDGLVFAAILVVFGRLADMTAGQILLVVVAFNLSTALRYARWHFHPYQEPPPPPVTRYTNPRYNKPKQQ